jgi:hypothetical protein
MEKNFGGACSKKRSSLSFSATCRFGGSDVSSPPPPGNNFREPLSSRISQRLVNEKRKVSFD